VLSVPSKEAEAVASLEVVVRELNMRVAADVEAVSVVVAV